MRLCRKYPSGEQNLLCHRGGGRKEALLRVQAIGGDNMWPFKRKEDYDIHCPDRKLKDLIDSCYHEKPEWDGYYETRVTYYVKEGIKYRDLLREILSEGYKKHKRDPGCDIPDYQTFLSLEKSMIDDRNAYQKMTV